MLAAALRQPDNVPLQLFLVWPDDVSAQRLEAPVINKNLHTRPIAGNVLNIGVLHEGVNLAVANQIALDKIVDFLAITLATREPIAVQDVVDRLLQELLLLLLQRFAVDVERPL